MHLYDPGFLCAPDRGADPTGFEPAIYFWFKELARFHPILITITDTMTGKNSP